MWSGELQRGERRLDRRRGTLKLYDTVLDVKELHNIASQRSATVRRLAAEMARIFRVSVDGLR